MAQDSFEMNRLTALRTPLCHKILMPNFPFFPVDSLGRDQEEEEYLIRLSFEDFIFPSNQIIFEAIKSLFTTTISR